MVSKETENIIRELNNFSGMKLKNAGDLAELIELAEKSQKEKLFYDIQFTAKYLNGLSKILESNVNLALNRVKDSTSEESKPAGEEAREKILKEYKANMLKLIGYIKDLLTEAEPEIKPGLEKKYLSLNRESMRNLTTLVYDLSWLKKYYNSKRES